MNTEQNENDTFLANCLELQESIVKSLLVKDSGNINANIRYIWNLINKEDVDEAISLASSLIVQLPDDWRLYFAKSYGLFYLKKYSSMIEYCAKIVESKKVDPIHFAVMGLAHYLNKNFVNAKKILEAYLNLESRYENTSDDTITEDTDMLRGFRIEEINKCVQYTLADIWQETEPTEFSVEYILKSLLRWYSAWFVDESGIKFPSCPECGELITEEVTWLCDNCRAENTMTLTSDLTCESCNEDAENLLCPHCGNSNPTFYYTIDSLLSYAIQNSSSYPGSDDNKIISRWGENSGEAFREELIRALSSDDPNWVNQLTIPTNFANVKKRLDIRGINIDDKYTKELAGWTGEKLLFHEIGFGNMPIERVMLDFSKNNNVHLHQLELANSSFSFSNWHSDFNDIAMHDCIASKVKWMNGWKRSKVTRCDFRLAELRAIWLKDIEFRNVSFEYSELFLQDDFNSGENSAKFINCKFNNASLRENHFEDFTFSNCSFNDTDFRDAHFKGAQFIDCKFDGAKMFGSTRDGCKFVNSNCSLIDYSKNGDGSLIRYFSEGEFDRVIYKIGSPDGEKAPKLFLCHASSDKSIVSAFAQEIKLKGIDIWFDSWEIKVGESLIDKIERGIEESNFMIIFLSSNSIKSNWVRTELKAGLVRDIEGKGIEVLPVILDDCEIPILLQDRRYVKLNNDVNSVVEEIVTRVTQ